MWIRWWTRLAGCIAIELAAAAAMLAADHEYKAAAASAGAVRAIAMEDSAGARAIIVQAAFPVSRHISDVAAAELMRSYGLERGAILFRGAASGFPPQPQDLLTAAAAALGQLKPARLMATADTLAALDRSDSCVAQIMADGSLAPEGAICGGRIMVKGRIRTAFRVIDLSHGLLQRGETGRIYPIQAIALGREIAILGLGGQPEAGAFAAPGVIVAGLANDDGPYPGHREIADAVRDVLKRVGR